MSHLQAQNGRKRLLQKGSMIIQDSPKNHIILNFPEQPLRQYRATSAYSVDSPNKTHRVQYSSFQKMKLEDLQCEFKTNNDQLIHEIGGSSNKANPWQFLAKQIIRPDVGTQKIDGYIQQIKDIKHQIKVENFGIRSKRKKKNANIRFFTPIQSSSPPRVDNSKPKLFQIRSNSKRKLQKRSTANISTTEITQPGSPSDRLNRPLRLERDEKGGFDQSSIHCYQTERFQLSTPMKKPKRKELDEVFENQTHLLVKNRERLSALKTGLKEIENRYENNQKILHHAKISYSRFNKRRISDPSSTIQNEISGYDKYYQELTPSMRKSKKILFAINRSKNHHNHQSHQNFGQLNQQKQSFDHPDNHLKIPPQSAPIEKHKYHPSTRDQTKSSNASMNMQISRTPNQSSKQFKLPYKFDQSEISQFDSPMRNLRIPHQTQAGHLAKMVERLKNAKLKRKQVEGSWVHLNKLDIYQIKLQHWKDNLFRNSENEGIIDLGILGLRGAYHNKSALDNTQNFDINSTFGLASPLSDDKIDLFEALEISQPKIN